MTQATVSRLVSGQAEPGPISKLLDMLEQSIVVLGPRAAREWVLDGTISPDAIADGLAAEALYDALKRVAASDAKAAAERPSHIMQAGFGNFA